MMVFVFEDLKTGDFQPVEAPNESAARLRLGDAGTDIERTKVFRRCESADLPKLIEEVMADETGAREAVTIASKSIGSASATSMDAAAVVHAAKTRHAQLKTLREQLLRIDAGR